MSFLFGRKSKQTQAALPPATRDVHTPGGSRSTSGPQLPNGVTSKGPTPTPANNLSNSLAGSNTPSPDQGVEQRGASDGDMQVCWSPHAIATSTTLCSASLRARFQKETPILTLCSLVCAPPSAHWAISSRQRH